MAEAKLLPGNPFGVVTEEAPPLACVHRFVFLRQERREVSFCNWIYADSADDFPS